eukprot:TRINITY_DN31892_c0_g1_i1.p1 TRINITY_DN31892_c0_g1~~TRINITY_DN31892_c0_g1_i1.p1  ORF type:complete len:339 (-),score=99.32 TRINITY_DN31892_c0_g1_i1:36-923(-)
MESSLIGATEKRKKKLFARISRATWIIIVLSMLNIWGNYATCWGIYVSYVNHTLQGADRVLYETLFGASGDSYGILAIDVVFFLWNTSAWCLSVSATIVPVVVLTDRLQTILASIESATILTKEHVRMISSSHREISKHIFMLNNLLGAWLGTSFMISMLLFVLLLNRIASTTSVPPEIFFWFASNVLVNIPARLLDGRMHSMTIKLVEAIAMHSHQPAETIMDDLSIDQKETLGSVGELATENQITALMQGIEKRPNGIKLFRSIEVTVKFLSEIASIMVSGFVVVYNIQRQQL